MRLACLLCAVLIGLPFAAQAEDSIPAKNIAALESAGTMSDIAAGAYEKTLWKDDKRSAIVEAIQTLPLESPLRSLHGIKRRLLLSQSDAALIDNDIDITADNNLFIIRLRKLQEMGLYEDALKLYTDFIDTPHNARLAETGLILMIHQRGLATACLEEKVLSPQFTGDEFFTLMDRICAFELGTVDDAPAIGQSDILTAALADENYKFATIDIAALTHLTPLEMAVLKSEGHFDYTTFETTPTALKNYPSRVLATFFDDKTLPEERKEALQQDLARRGHVSVKKLPAAKAAKQLGVDVADKKRNDDEAGADALFWAAMTPLLRDEKEIVTLTPYAGLLKDADPDAAPDPLFNRALAVLLASGYDLPAPWCDRAGARTGHEAAVYYQTLIFLQACEEASDKPVDNLETALEAIPEENRGNLWVIMGLLAPKTENYADFLITYEKQFPLTLHEDYVMHKGADASQAPEIQAFNGFGLRLLHVAGTVKGRMGEKIEPSVLQMALKSLLNGDLDSDARDVAKEVFVGILQR